MQAGHAEQGEDFEAAILAALEISPYDLAVLERQLVSEKWVPDSTGEGAIKDAVFRFRKSYKDRDYYQVFSGNRRLRTLFEVWNDEEVAEWETNADRSPRETFELELKRETAKYNAVRALIAHLAARKKSKSGDDA